MIDTLGEAVIVVVAWLVFILSLAILTANRRRVG